MEKNYQNPIHLFSFGEIGTVTDYRPKNRLKIEIRLSRFMYQMDHLDATYIAVFHIENTVKKYMIDSIQSDLENTPCH